MSALATLVSPGLHLLVLGIHDLFLNRLARIKAFSFTSRARAVFRNHKILRFDFWQKYFESHIMGSLRFCLAVGRLADCPTAHLTTLFTSRGTITRKASTRQICRRRRHC